jgi:hypothetical protein
MELTLKHLLMMRALHDGDGCPADMVEFVCTHAGAAEADFRKLLYDGLVAPGAGPRAGRFVLTELGRTVYRREKKRRGHRI